MKRALTIGGSDPSGGAGIQKDLVTFAALGVWGLSAITTITVQDTAEVSGRADCPPDVIADQIEKVVRDIGVDATKTGLLPTAAAVRAVARALPEAPLVVDPVFRSTSGQSLADEDVADAIRDELLARALIVTPNTEEAERLTGIAVTSRAGQEEAARALVALGAGAALVKGGHLHGPESIDVLADAEGMLELQAARLNGGPVRGTGCMLSAAITAGLAQGRSLRDTVADAKKLVADALARAIHLGEGAALLDPLER